MRSWWLRLISGVVAVVALVFASAEWRFGSIRTARAYYRGQIVSVSVPEGQLAPRPKGRIEFPLLVTNNSPYPITLLGAHTTCRCADVAGLPITVPALQAGLLRVSAAVGTAEILLYTEAAQVPANVTVTPEKVTMVNP
jgi:hypothetical protein